MCQISQADTQTVLENPFGKPCHPRRKGHFPAQCIWAEAGIVGELLSAKS